MRGLVPALLVALALAAGAGTFLACRERSAGASDSPVALAADSPAVLGEVPDFALTERSGRTVTRAALAGKVWIAGFVFTRCSGPCPRISATMRQLQDRLGDTRAQLVSFSVETLFDSPEVLRDYAAALGADPERWWMLTGEQQRIDDLVPALLPKPQRSDDPNVPTGERITHHARLMVVDGRGRLRGLYSGETLDDLELILARVRFLEQER